MFGHIYKLQDGLYHLMNIKNKKTQCGKEMCFIKEDRIIGVKGNERFTDPDKKDCCLICFDFLNT